MAINSNKFIKFSDVTQLQSEGFVQRPNHGYNLSSNQLMTKTEVNAVWAIDATYAPFAELASNQWVARWRMQEPGASAGFNIMGTLSCGGSTHNSITVNWTDPESVKAGQTIDYWERQHYYLGDPGTTWGNSTQINGAATRTTTIQGLTYDNVIAVRIRFHTTIGEFSNWEEWSCSTTMYNPTTTYLSVNNNTDVTYVYLWGAGNNDYITIEFTVNSGNTSSDWYILDNLSINGPVDYIAKSWEDTIPFTKSTIVYTGDGTSFYVLRAQMTRPMTGYFYGTVRITNSSQGFSYNSTPVTFNLLGSESGQ